MKTLFVFFLLFGLSSCSGSIIPFSNNDTEVGLEVYENENISLKLPNSWAEVSQSELPIPNQGEIILAYKAIQERDGYYNNIMILRDANILKENPMGLMNNSINTLRNTLQSFSLVKESDISVNGKDTGRLIVFQGKYGPQTPLINYIQTAQNCPDGSYFITISVGGVLDDYTRYLPILESFTCKK